MNILTLHGVFMRMFELGVLLTGPSGVGKSELALELLTRGHHLIADDAADFARDETGALVGRCPPLLRGFLEARSLGILNVQKMFGEACLIDQHRLDLVIRLEVRSEVIHQPHERLEGRRSVCTIQGIEFPEISIPIRLGHNLAVLVEAACRDQHLRLKGYRADEDFVARQLQAIQDSHN
jgi:HPr kinase/phosphorylase